MQKETNPRRPLLAHASYFSLNHSVDKEDPLIASHVADALLSVDKNRESITLLAEKIKDYPYLIPLLLK